MAKAKKTTPTSATGKKSAGKSAKPQAPATPPRVDTVLAAQAAAKQLVASSQAGPLATPPAGKESASFKAMKQNLSNPTASGLDSVLDKTALPGSRKPNAPFTGPRSGPGGGGRNQTFGADVNRTGVPRRTSGG